MATQATRNYKLDFQQLSETRVAGTTTKSRRSDHATSPLLLTSHLTCKESSPLHEEGDSLILFDLISQASERLNKQKRRKKYQTQIANWLYATGKRDAQLILLLVTV